MRTKSKRQRRKVRVEKLKKKLSVFSTWISGRLERKRKREIENERERMRKRENEREKEREWDREWEREREIEWENREREETIIVPDILLNCATTWYEHRSERKTEKRLGGLGIPANRTARTCATTDQLFSSTNESVLLVRSEKKEFKKVFFVFFRWRGQDLSSLRVRLVRFSR